MNGDIVGTNLPSSMWALVKKRAGPGLVLEEVPVPQPSPGEVLVKVLRTGICGTDLYIERWNDWAARTIPLPLIPGHEFVGEVMFAGPGTGGVEPGQLVSAEGHVVCGQCRHCLDAKGHLCLHAQGLGVARPGAFAQYVRVPAASLWRHRPGPPGHGRVV
ncbi:alcohol dehydrogenase catalytic domain-containing protein [Actinomadura sp. KC06]|uniref:alcohol dehydrogenase catalytic domain-containing protein n=1 Tax=Actinomadura sp. KC06 TaxID=2530369 RepID=UPI001FB72B7E|nr:alcohol dehydrogenase catalytic domain-containing protein [Actinomadura sp. KC06]